MVTAWENHHRRAAVLRQVRQHIEATRDSTLPWDDACATVFIDQHDLLMALHRAWSNQLAARVELALETGEDDVMRSVALARKELANRLPGLRRVLDPYADDPALAHLRRIEHRLLAVAAGLATLDDPADRAAEVGARVAAEVGTRVAAEVGAGAAQPPPAAALALTG